MPHNILERLREKKPEGVENESVKQVVFADKILLNKTDLVKEDTMEGQVNIGVLQNWIGRLIEEDGANLYRYKGVMAVKGMPTKFVFQGVGMLFTGEV